MSDTINPLEQAMNALSESLGSNFEEQGGIEVLASMLSLPDDEFETLSPFILNSLEKSLNSMNDKFALVKALSINGMRGEDLLDIYEKSIEEIDTQLNDISQQKKDFVKQIMGMICNAITDTEGLSKRIIQVPIQILDERARIPEYAHGSDSGMDVFALEDVTINPGETKIIRTGIAVALPLGYELQVRPKSGRCANSKLRVANTPGTIDAGYRDEIGIIIENIEAPIQDIQYEKAPIEQVLIVRSILHGKSYTISAGEKIAQLVLAEVPKATFYEVENVREIGEDRGGGFGSSGLK